MARSTRTFRRRIPLLWYYFARLIRYSVVLSVFAAALAGLLVTAGLIAAGPLDAAVASAEAAAADTEGAGADAASVGAASAGAASAGAGDLPFPARLAVVLAGALVATLGHWLGVIVMRLVHAREAPFYEAGGWRGSTLALASWPLSALVGTLVIVLGPFVVAVVSGA